MNLKFTKQLLFFFIISLNSCFCVKICNNIEYLNFREIDLPYNPNLKNIVVLTNSNVIDSFFNSYPENLINKENFNIDNFNFGDSTLILFSKDITSFDKPKIGEINIKKNNKQKEYEIEVEIITNKYMGDFGYCLNFQKAVVIENINQDYNFKLITKTIQKKAHINDLTRYYLKNEE